MAECVIFCYACKNKIRFFNDESKAQCAYCNRVYKVYTGIPSLLKATGVNPTYNINLNNEDFKFSSKENLGLISGTTITLVKHGRKIVGVSDHQRELWFNTVNYKKPSKVLEIITWIAILFTIIIFVKYSIAHLIPALIAIIILAVSLFLSQKYTELDDGIIDIMVYEIDD